MILSGNGVRSAIVLTEREDVLVAKMVSFELMAASSMKRVDLVSVFSIMASMMRGAQQSFIEWVKEMRFKIFSLSAVSISFFSTSRFSSFSITDEAVASISLFRSYSMAGIPALATVRVMPLPMVP